MALTYVHAGVLYIWLLCMLLAEMGHVVYTAHVPSTMSCFFLWTRMMCSKIFHGNIMFVFAITLYTILGQILLV